jgi:hypothetical protein
MGGLQEHRKTFKMKVIFEYVVITGIFLTIMVPLVGGIIHYLKENKRLDRESRQ